MIFVISWVHLYESPKDLNQERECVGCDVTLHGEFMQERRDLGHHVDTVNTLTLLTKKVLYDLMLSITRKSKNIGQKSNTTKTIELQCG